MEETNRSKRKIVILCMLTLLIVAVGAGVYLFVFRKQTGDDQMGQREKMMQSESGIIAASGATMVGMEEETFALQTTDSQLVVEEVYLASGDEVEAGSKILKFTEDSLKAVQSELAHAQKEAELAYRQGLIDYQIAVIEAKSAYDTILLEAEYAQTDYQTSLAEAQDEIDQLKEELEEAQELYEEYYDGIYEQGYEKLYEVAEKKELYETNEALYWDTLKKWNIDDSHVNNSSGGARTMSSGGTMQSARGGISAGNSDQISALELIEDTYRANKEDYEQALEDCEKAVKTATAGMEQAKAEYDLLVLELEQAEIDYEKKAATYLADYEAALSEGTVAENTYNTEMKRQQETLDTLWDEKEDTQDCYTLFQESVADGYLYTQNRGTIIMVMAAKGSPLEEDAMILAYSNPDTVTVSASVEQSDIAALSVGEEAVVVSGEYGNLAGTITKINPVSNSGGRSSITYTVEVTLQEGHADVQANRTVTVYFGISLEEYEQQAAEATNNRPEGTMPEGEMPEGTSPQRPEEQGMEARPDSAGEQRGGGF